MAAPGRVVVCAVAQSVSALLPVVSVFVQGPAPVAVVACCALSLCLPSGSVVACFGGLALAACVSCAALVCAILSQCVIMSHFISSQVKFPTVRRLVDRGYILPDPRLQVMLWWSVLEWGDELSLWWRWGVN